MTLTRDAPRWLSFWKLGSYHGWETDIRSRGVTPDGFLGFPTMLFQLVPFLQVGFAAAAVISGRAVGPTVTLDDGSVFGTSTGAVDKFLGIPFGKAPYVLFHITYASIGNL